MAMHLYITTLKSVLHISKIIVPGGIALSMYLRLYLILRELHKPMEHSIPERHKYIYVIESARL